MSFNLSKSVDSSSTTSSLVASFLRVVVSGKIKIFVAIWLSGILLLEGTFHISKLPVYPNILFQLSPTILSFASVVALKLSM